MSVTKSRHFSTYHTSLCHFFCNQDLNWSCIPISFYPFYVLFKWTTLRFVIYHGWSSLHDFLTERLNIPLGYVFKILSERRSLNYAYLSSEKRNSGKGGSVDLFLCSVTCDDYHFETDVAVFLLLWLHYKRKKSQISQTTSSPLKFMFPSLNSK